MKTHLDQHLADASDTFPTDPAGLSMATGPMSCELVDGDVFDLQVIPVAKQINGTTVRMLGYNGSIPGPTLRVRQGTEITVHVTNHGDLETTVHWHGLRLQNRYDGVPHETQIPIPVGGSFSYRLRFPDPGLYWYHPHVREDYGQELGLYGNIVVEPAEPEYWPPVHREVVLTLDDLLVEDGRIAPFRRTQTNYAAMGRFGNVLLVGGEPAMSLTARTGEVIRLYLTNTANTRVFNVVLPGARMRLVGGDSGRYERAEIVDEVLLAPSERAVVDVRFDRPGRLLLEHRTPDRSYPLATIAVTDEPVEPALAAAFDRPHGAPELAAERQRLDAHLTTAPDKVLALVAEMDDIGHTAGDGPTTYGCPMHPHVTSTTPGRCPECGMKLMPTSLAADHTGHHADAPGTGHDHHGDAHPPNSPGDGVEWEDDMVELNRMTTPANTRWKLIDRETGAENHHIDWRFRVGDRVKIRLVNEMDSDHPMHHPFHLHGAGRFLILARDGVTEPNLVWKDTVLVRTGQTVDILFHATEPGLWMAHCHIAEHMQSGMMFSFIVDRETK
jgi:FtsP/CotA-like multicopper oxidase with cupredoxin domain